MSRRQYFQVVNSLGIASVGLRVNREQIVEIPFVRTPYVRHARQPSRECPGTNNSEGRFDLIHAFVPMFRCLRVWSAMSMH